MPTDRSYLQSIATNGIPDIADRLKTRIAWGLLADIEPPELEVRLAILRQKAATEQVELPDDVGLYIATAIRSDVARARRRLDSACRLRVISQAPHRLGICPETLGAAISRPLEDHHGRRCDSRCGQLLQPQACRYQKPAPTQVLGLRQHVLWRCTWLASTPKIRTRTSAAALAVNITPP